ncbi:tRNA-dihydrouridine synthase [Legionella antarctica]|uniref:tRNA-dihydrouridine synthase n=2 Tax=Legionella antarctica TaxID=2708020 RepID=A0A6F8T9V4_9GAMM|nr:tRNA-dihydrouridine synthase [Legionella antarctica]
MSSAIDILHKHAPQSRYLYRSPKEKILAYQISGNDMHIMAQAALLLETQGADLIDINCGCPKTKIRKKGAGSALLEEPKKLVDIIKKVRETISIPLTIKIRIQGNENDMVLAKKIAEAGADALIVHGRRWMDDYDIECDLHQIAQIKQHIHIPVIANGDISNSVTLKKALEISDCDAFMIARAGSGCPWLYQELLEQQPIKLNQSEKIKLFIQHLEGLAHLEDEFKAVLQSRSLVRYYFKKQLDLQQLAQFYKLRSLEEITLYLQQATFE